CGLLAMGALALFSTHLRADFIPPYDVPQGFERPYTLSSGSVTSIGSWTLQTLGTPQVYTGSLVLTDPSQISLQTGASFAQGFQYALDLQFAHEILSTGTLSFDYSLSLEETIGIPAGWNHGGYILDGVLTQLPAGTGSISLAVKAGDVFAFDAYGSALCIGCFPNHAFAAGAATLTITHFVAPVPEPSVALLCFVGSAAFLAMQAARRVRRTRLR
ncbi:MAG TPA: hypothetical protein VJ721_07680, partial [Chthoniobacterales bacterium]|nr:hypothetical protein [Chthoniobacterales bacterium]